MREFLYIDPDHRGLLQGAGLDGLDAVLSHSQGQRLDKPGLEPWRERWRIPVSEPGGGSSSLYLKRFLRPPLSRQIRRWLGGNPQHATAHVEFANTQALAARKIGAARAIAMGERFVGPCEQASFVILKEVKGESLETVACRQLVEGARFDSGEAEALAQFVAGFHREGFVHRDLYLCHIFRTAGRSGLVPDDYVLIDLQRVMRPAWRRVRWIVKDLAALDFSTPPELLGIWGRLRFLVRYTRAYPAAGSARSLAVRIHRRSRRMHDRDRARPTETSSPAASSAGTAADLLRSSS